MPATGAAAMAVDRTPWKRPFDLIVGGFLLAVLSPLMAGLALLVRLDAPGPAFYRQERIGRYGDHFRIWKFRSMYVHNDVSQHQQMAAAWFAAPDLVRGYKSLRDRRVTR